MRGILLAQISLFQGGFDAILRLSPSVAALIEQQRRLVRSVLLQRSP
jgi:hypothetical protein